MEDMDDSPDKLRRNLVVGNSLVIGFVFLRPKLAASGALFGIDLTSVAPGKMWTVVVIIQIYVLLRYHYSESRKVDLRIMLDDHTAFSRKLIERLLKRDFFRIIDTREGLYFDRDRVWQVCTERNEGNLRSTDVTHIEFQVNPTPTLGHTLYNGAATFQFRNNTRDGNTETGGVGGASFKVPLRIYRWLFARASIRVALLSPALVNLGIPYFIAAAGFFVSSRNYKLIVSTLFGP